MFERGQVVGTIFERNGAFLVKRTYKHGHIASIRGVHIDGLTGPETMFEEQFLMPIAVFEIVEDRVEWAVAA